MDNITACMKAETFEIAVEFLELELARTKAMGSATLVLHPGSHVGEGVKAGVEQIAKGINEVLTRDTKVLPSHHFHYVPSCKTLYRNADRAVTK